MRLKKLKMAGFKSFVDPTTVNFQTNLAGIVGPNGCGKSNIIDAVRWVMGESSAKQLRGESMSDVIFNGSSSRKQVGQASVELYFDNSDASLGGEYAKYNEISIRREVGRDGISNYYFNNSNCRRKDIIDIFLGTGLGANSYGIISQGTISQFIEAKPDDLKVYLDEAAGISKYKERRRETENRIKHTRENLARLNDIRDELEKQLTNLKNQANKAELYKKHKQTERLLKAEVNALYWQNLNDKFNELEIKIKEEESSLESKITEQHIIDAKIAEFREEQNIRNDVFNEVQTRYYRIGSNIARLEQQIRHDKERREQLEQELTKNKELIQETLQHKNNDSEQIELFTSECAVLTTDINNFSESLIKAKQELEISELQMAEWQINWDTFNAETADVNQSFEVEQVRIKHLDHLIAVETSHIEKIQSELSSFHFENLENDINVLDNKQNEVKAYSDELHETLSLKQSQISQKREYSDKLSTELDGARGKMQSILGRYASLEALQQAALGKNDSSLVRWLEENNFENNLRLVQGIDVEHGWEIAAETVLGDYLEAVCLDNMNVLAAFTENLPHGHLVFFDTNNDNSFDSNVFNKALRLDSKVKAKWEVAHLLSGVYIAETFEEALNLRKLLTHHESVITKDGIWFGQSWLRVNSGVSNKLGILQREQELRELETLIPEEQKNISSKEQELQNTQNELFSLEQQYHDLQQKLREITVSAGEIQGDIGAKKKHLDYLRDREQILRKEIMTHEQALSNGLVQLEETKNILVEIQAKKEINNQNRNILLGKRDEYQQAVDSARTRVEEEKQKRDAVVMRLELLQGQIGYLKQSIERGESRLIALQDNYSSILKSLDDTKSPTVDLEEDLARELQARVVVENELTLAKQRVGDGEHNQREYEERRSILQEEIRLLSTILEKLRIDSKELQVKNSNYQEQIAELGFDMDKVISEISKEANITEWEEKFANIVKRIENLGAINLAAIEEFEIQKERKDYLDSQNQDLVQALETLESAIAKIDNDTINKFKETFDRVNQSFQENFPKIFNGGNAYLELTDNNILDAGVIIFAQPPGKRNSTIHLLSGGEKALTAISLIFAIFQLNPAPFCMLDEVDAPLDDANVGRFCNLVEEMSKSVQLIFISHNKLTLEMAEQLNGVTMQEPGVSRIVSVDIQQAMAMQETHNE